MKNQWKMDQKSIKTRSKMDQKSIKNRPKSRSGGLRGRFGGLLGRLGRSKGFLRASWTVLEASWKRLGREKWPTWLQLGSQNGAKMVQKSIKILIIFWMPLGIDFLSNFDRFFDPKWRQVGTKIDQKSMSTSKGDFLKNRALPAAGARFFKIRVAKLGAKIDQKSIKIWSPRWVPSWHRFLMNFGGFWEASWI